VISFSEILREFSLVWEKGMQDQHSRVLRRCEVYLLSQM